MEVKTGHEKLDLKVESPVLVLVQLKSKCFEKC